MTTMPALVDAPTAPAAAPSHPLEPLNGEEIAAAGCTFVMGLPGADDVVLNYQSTSFHDALYVHRVLGRRPAPEFEAWLERVGVFDAQGGHRRLLDAAPPTQPCPRSAERDRDGLHPDRARRALGPDAAVHARPHRH